MIFLKVFTDTRGYKNISKVSDNKDGDDEDGDNKDGDNKDGDDKDGDNEVLISRKYHVK